MKERTKFCLEWERRWNAARGGQVNVAELCRVFGISRETGYVWIRRFKSAGFDLRALEERSRRPLSSPNATSEALQNFIVDARKAHPTWGPRKLRAWLSDRYSAREFPSASAIAGILKRRGLTLPRRGRRRRGLPIAGEAFAPATASNSVWCMDFKGHFRLGNGERCGPLTINDAFSRYCLRCEIVEEGTYEEVQRVLDSAFREFGIPAGMRTDNGPPFASSGPLGLTKLAVWLLRLGLRLERIQPGKPQQNGRQERFHRTLEAETAAPPRSNARSQQRAFDLFRREYNEERPHEALGQRPPARVYRASSRLYPCGLIPIDASFGQLCAVDAHGTIRWMKRRVFISTALAYEKVEVAPAGNTTWAVLFRSLELGVIDEEHPEREFVQAARPRKSHCLALDGGLIRDA